MRLSAETALTLLVVVFPVGACFALYLAFRFWM
jgi:hypothetical protein